MNPNQQQNQPFQPSVPPQGQYQQPISGSALPHQPSKLPLILAVVFGLLFLATAVFALWAFSERTDYKNNSDEKSAAAVEVALDEQKETLTEEFAEQLKEPFLTFNGPSTYGSFSFDYPRTWSVYVEEAAQSNDLYTVFMHPNAIKDIDEKQNLHAFSVQVVSTKYEDEIRRVESAIDQGKLQSFTYRLAQVESVLGLRIKGELENDVIGQRIFLPIRDRTLIITTESNDYTADFDRILSSFSFTP